MKTLFKKLIILAMCSVVLIAQMRPSQAGGGAPQNIDCSTTEQIPPPNITCPNLPCQIPPHNTPTPQEARPYFDWFSWQSFIALNWPAAVTSGSPVRGQPDASKTIGDLSAPRVWETWKAEWETFRPAQTGNPNLPGIPTAWSSYAVDPNVFPCANANTAFLQSGGKLLVMATKMDSALNQVNEAFAGPLIAQNCTFVRYEVRVNEDEYTTILTQQLYIAAKQPTVINLDSSSQSPTSFASCPNRSGNPTCTYGAIELKASWRELKPGEDTSRYYTTKALLVESPTTSSNCRQATMGLVGMHIAHKANPFREWVWSTFEHVDNVPPDGYKPNPNKPPPACSGVPSPFTFNNGYLTPPTTDGYNYEPKEVTPPLSQNPSPPVQVSRVTPIDNPAQAGKICPTTSQINQMFQSALKGTVWQYYELVSTQWPTLTGNFNPSGNYPQACDTPFPADPVANTTMETYFQSATSAMPPSCMDCHFMVANQDFSWILNMEAFVPAQTGKLLKGDVRTPVTPAVQKLRQLMERNRRTHIQLQRQTERRLGLRR